MILPPGDPAQAWSPHHHRLHRHLLRQPTLLPQGAPLLLAVSGGQDSLALTALLADLVRLHHWRLELWHGDHGWRQESAAQARSLAAWAQARQLPLHLERADPPPNGEAAARSWRYGRLGQLALQLGCRHVVTGHTASDRAETLLLNLARGCHRRGLASLGGRRPLGAPTPRGTAAQVSTPQVLPELVRPLLGFSRDDTARVCRDLALPVQEDPSNQEPRFARNRLRAEVMPVLEALHPGAGRRIAALAQRLEEELEQEEELLTALLESLRPEGTSADRSLSRPGLARLGLANRRRLLALWLRHQGRPPLASQELEQLAVALDPEGGSGERPLAGAWLLRWDRSTLVLQTSGTAPNGHG